MEEAVLQIVGGAVWNDTESRELYSARETCKSVVEDDGSALTGS